MDLRPLGATGMKVSPLSLGTVKFGRTQGLRYPQEFSLPDDRQLLKLLALARDLGINLLDTAPAYGSSEQRLGDLLPKLGGVGDWIISTKVGETFHDGHSTYDFSAALTRASIERSLKTLKRETLDIILIHSNGDDERILQEEDCLDVLLDLKRQGLIRAVGMSSKTLQGGLLALPRCDVMMLTYNLANADDLPLIRQAHRDHKGVLIKKGLLSGHLNNFEQWGESSNPVQASMQLLLSEPGISSVVVGTINPDHLRANVQAARSVTHNE